MKFCKECGTKLADEAAFCNECGTSFEATKQTQPTPPQMAPVPKKPLTKKQKRMLFAGSILVILLFTAHQIIGSFMSKERLIEKFETALHEQDAKAVANLLSTDDKKMDVNEKSVKGLMAYWKENPDEVKNITNQLKQQATLFDSAKKDEVSYIDGFFEEYYDYSLVTLKQDGKFLVYDKYKLDILSVYLTLETNYKDTVLVVDGKEVGTADKPDFEATYGPFLPGYHTVQAKLKTDFVELASEEQIYISGYEDKETEGIYLEAEDVTVHLPDQDDASSAKLLINGKDVGINPYETPTFGPVLTDGSMTLAVETTLPWGTVKTEEVPIDDDDMNISYLTDDVQKAMMDSVFTYLQEWGPAYTTADVSKFSTTSPDWKETILTSSTDAKEDDSALKVKYLGSDFDLDSLELYPDDENWVGYVTANNYWNQDYFDVGDEPEMEDYENTHTYTLYYDSKAKKWLVDDVSSSWYFDDENIKEYKVKEAKTYTSAWAS
jgi:uncharacterized membrane protein YvbJ